MKNSSKSTNIQTVLINELEKSRLRNPAYSIRAFSKKLSMSHAAVSEIINGKRNVSEKLAERIADKLLLDPLQKETLLKNYKKNGNKNIKNMRTALQLTADQYFIVSDWCHFAILSLVRTDSFVSSVDWIAKRLNINKRVAKDAVSRLTRLKMLDTNSDGCISSTGKSFNSPDGIPNSSVRKSHAQNLDLARQSLEIDPIDIRDFSAITMAIDTKKIPEARVMIRRFRDELCEFLESGNKDEVYKMCFQLIPITRTEEINK